MKLALIGAGDLGAAMGRAFIERGQLLPENLHVATCSGTAARLADIPGIHIGTDPVAAATGADIVLLAVPPANANDIRLGAPSCPVLSVMAGVSLAQLEVIAGHQRVIRAMSSPAAMRGLAFSPYFAGQNATDADKELVRNLLDSCGSSDEIFDEGQIDIFTALTGPVPGFVAAFAEMLIDYSVARGVEPAVADRAVRQLMLGSGVMLAETAPSAADRVQEMINYAGTTAKGLSVMKDSTIFDQLCEALDASVASARTIGGPGL